MQQSEQIESTPARPTPALSSSPLAARRDQTLGLNIDPSGSYDFHRIIKSGEVLKRKKRTRTWKPVQLVLRPKVLSIYRDSEATQLKHQVRMSEITAIAQRQDLRRKGDHVGVFGIFSPSRNFHLEAPTADEARSWVEVIRREARLNEADDDLVVASPGGTEGNYSGFGRFMSFMHDGSSSAELPTVPMVSDPARGRGSSSLDYSGNERASNSDFAETPLASSSSDGYLQVHHGLHGFTPLQTSPPRESTRLKNNGSQVSVAEAAAKEERIVRQGYLLALKSLSGVRQWKKYWVVLRPKYFTLYKTDQEYEASLILQVSDIVDAVDIDPVSKSKQHCMQVITEVKTYRFCAANEDELAQWLGSLKTVLARRREVSKASSGGAS